MLTFLTVVTMLVTVVMAFHVDAEDKQHTKNSEIEKDKIHITADTLISESETGVAEFIGNVRAIQERTVITSDSLKIYYKQDVKNKKNGPTGEASIEKIVASGNVKITFDNKVAVTQQAVYQTEARILILSGANSKVISGNDSISGEKITYYRNDERIKVESGPEQRVEAVFSSGGKGLQ